MLRVVIRMLSADFVNSGDNVTLPFSKALFPTALQKEDSALNLIGSTDTACCRNHAQPPLRGGSVFLSLEVQEVVVNRFL